MDKEIEYMERYVQIAKELDEYNAKLKSNERRVAPWECVRELYPFTEIYKLSSFSKHPDFLQQRTDDLQFAVSIVEGYPAFEGDTIYIKGHKHKVVGAGRFMPDTIRLNGGFPVSSADYSWTAPEGTIKEMTFNLNGKMLRSPVKAEVIGYADHDPDNNQFVVIDGIRYGFEVPEDANSFRSAIQEILNEALHRRT